MSYTITPCNAASSRQAILDLWQRNLPDASAERYPWLYESGLASGFLLRSKQGEPVGAAGLMRRDFIAFGQPVIAGQAIDLNVDESHRTGGPALRLQRAVLAAVNSGEIGMAYAFPNRLSEPVLRRVGYRSLGELQRWVKILSYRAVFHRWRWPHRLSRCLAAIADPFMPANHTARRHRLASGIRVAETEAFDERFDRLWRRSTDQFPIQGDRGSAYLDWRFAQCPDQRYRAFVLVEPDGELLGYVVYGRRGETIYLADLLVADVKQVAPLLAAFLRLARRQGAEMAVMLYFGSPAICQALRRFGFWQRPSGRKAMVYDSNRALPETAFQPDCWHLTGADIDTDE